MTPLRLYRDREEAPHETRTAPFRVLYISQALGMPAKNPEASSQSKALLEALHLLGVETTLAVEAGPRGVVTWGDAGLDSLAPALRAAVRAADVRAGLIDARPVAALPGRRPLVVRWRDRVTYRLAHDQRELVSNTQEVPAYDDPDLDGSAHHGSQPVGSNILRCVQRFSLERNLYSWAVARALDGRGPVEIDASPYDLVIFDAPHFIRPTGIAPERMLLVLHDVVAAEEQPTRGASRSLAQRQQGSALARNGPILFASGTVRERALERFPHLRDRASGVVPEIGDDGGHRLALMAVLGEVAHDAGLPRVLDPPSVPGLAVPAIHPAPPLVEVAARAVALPVSPRPASPVSVGFLILADTASEEALSATLRSLDSQDGAWTALIGRSQTSPAPSLPASRHHTISVGPVGPEGASMGAAYRALLEASEHDYVAVLEPGDEVVPGALRALASEAHGADILYSDEELSDAPFLALKPGWSPEVLHAFNYFGRLTLVRRTLALEAGAFPPEVSAAAEWDCNLRVTARTDRIRRVPQVLCRRRPNSDRDRPAASDPRSADYREALRAYWARQGVQAAVTTQGDGTQRATWPIVDPPLVSIIIPTRDKADLLATCLEGLLHGTSYPNLEIILVDNLSREAGTHEFYRTLVSAGQVRLVRFDRPFNYSAACNAGAAEAQGELLLFLNNDIEVTSPDWLDELVRYAQLRGVGSVGTMLVYPSGVLQHAGAVYGLQLCGLIFRYAPLDDWNIFGSPGTPRTYLSVMGACQMVRRDVFERVGGYDERYHLSGSDAAIGLRAWRAGYRTAYTPHARLIHHEGATRGPGNPWEDTVQLARDIRAVGLEEDPYHHPGLDPRFDLSVRREDGQLTGAEYLRHHVEHELSRTPPATRLDIFNDLAVADAFRLERDDALWPNGRPEAFEDLWSAARFCIQLLRTRPDLRERFPRALSEGPGGAFRAWLVGDAARVFGLPARAPEQIDLAFSADLSARVTQRVLADRALLNRHPLGLTPASRRELIGWLLGAGRSDYGFRIEEVWWFILTWGETPRVGLEVSYLFNPDWQRAFPTALTPYGWPEFAAWVARSFGVTETWLEPDRLPDTLPPADQLLIAYRSNEAWRRAHPSALHDPKAAESWLSSLSSPPATDLVDPGSRQAMVAELTRPGLILLAPLNHPSEAQAAADSLSSGLEQAGWAVGRRDLWVDTSDRPHRIRQAALVTRPIVIVHATPEHGLHDTYDRAGLAEPRLRPYRIGYWYSPFRGIPDRWAERAVEYDEIWVPTISLAEGLAPRVACPVLAMPPGVEVPPVMPRPLGAFGVPEGDFTVVSLVETGHDLYLQNTLGLIRAFRAAFPVGHGARLVLGLQGTTGSGIAADVRRAAQQAGVALLSGLGSGDLLALVAGCDLYADLNRAPGYGLSVRRAMLLGRPILATRAGGFLDLLTDRNSLLVEGETSATEGNATNRSPSVQQAAALLQQAYNERDTLRERGRAARDDMDRVSGPATHADLAAQRLAVIDGALRAGRLPPDPIWDGVAGVLPARAG